MSSAYLAYTKMLNEEVVFIALFSFISQLTCCFVVVTEPLVCYEEPIVVEPEKNSSSFVVRGFPVISLSRWHIAFANVAILSLGLDSLIPSPQNGELSFSLYYRYLLFLYS